MTEQLVERWVRLLLRTFPREFSLARSQEILDFVREEGAASGRWSLGAVARLTWDLVGASVRVRLRERRRRREEMDGMNGKGRWTMGMAHDLRLAARSLRRTPGFALTVVATLALGVGLNSALFSVIHGVVLTPLEYDEPDRLVTVTADLVEEGIRDVSLSGGDLRDFQVTASAFARIEGLATIRQNLVGAGVPRQVSVGWVSEGFLAMLGVEPALGRLHAPDDPPGTVVLGYPTWRDGFGSDPDVIGSTIQLDGHPHVVVGVLPAGFRLRFPRAGQAPEIDLWKNPDDFWQNGDAWSAQGPEFNLIKLLGRLAPGVSVEDAQAQADGIEADLRARFSGWNDNGLRLTVAPLHDRIVEGVRPTLSLLFGAVGLLLLIACANVANLLAVRAHTRRREVAVRLALGSAGARVGRLFLFESFLLALSGAVVGLAIAAAFVELVPRYAPPELPLADQIDLDPAVLVFALAAALVVSVIVGFLPAVGAIRTQPGAILGNGRTLSPRAGRLRDTLVATQVALSLVLLVGAGLMVSSLRRLQSVDTGFASADLYTFGVTIPGTGYGWPEEAGRFYRAVEERVAAIPGVQTAGVVWPMPFGGSWSGEVQVVEGDVRELGLTRYELATEGFFHTSGISLQDGRLFRDGDARHVAVISRSLAERAFPGQSAIGRLVHANPWGGGPEAFEVVGVVGDARYRSLREPSSGQIYFDVRSWSWVDWEVHVLARTSVPEATLLPLIRQAVAELDGDVPVGDPAPMGELVGRQTASNRFVLALLSVFAVTAAALALIGLYGVVAFSVGIRAREIGVRMALGSGRTGIQSMVVRHGLALALGGIAAGVLGALALSRLLGTLLYDVRPTDPVTYAAAVALLVVASVAASWLPARRASRLDPVEILRAD